MWGSVRIILLDHPIRPFVSYYPVHCRVSPLNGLPSPLRVSPRTVLPSQLRPSTFSASLVNRSSSRTRATRTGNRRTGRSQRREEAAATSVHRQAVAQMSAGSRSVDRPTTRTSSPTCEALVVIQSVTLLSLDLCTVYRDVANWTCILYSFEAGFEKPIFHTVCYVHNMQF